LFSLSKLGLPAVRTGIIVANEEIVEAISRANAILNLATASVGPELVLKILESRRINGLRDSIVKPFYKSRGDAAMGVRRASMQTGADWAVHRVEGSMFFWLWIRNLKITTAELGRILKEENIIGVPGHLFVPVLVEEWDDPQ